MSNLGDQLQDEIDAILSLETAAEKGDGSDGDPFADELDAFVQEVQRVFDDAEPDAHDHSAEAVGGATPLTSITTEKAVTDSITTVEGSTFADIQAAIDAGNKHILLKRGETYTGSSTILLPKDIRVDAKGAVLEYSGSGIAIDTEQENYSKPYQYVKWEGGTLSGNSNATVGFRIHDRYGSHIEFEQIEGFSTGHGIKVENSDAWSEFNRIIGTTFSANLNHIYFEPATGSEAGTASFKGTIIDDLHMEGPESGGTGIYCQGAVYDSHISRVRCNSGADTDVIHIEGAMGGTVIDNIVTETQGDTGVTAVDVGSFGGTTPDIRRVFVHDSSDTAVYMNNPNNVSFVKGFTGHGARILGARGNEDVQLNIKPQKGSPNTLNVVGKNIESWVFKNDSGDRFLEFLSYGDKRVKNFPGNGFNTGSPIRFGNGVALQQRGDPTTSEMDRGDSMTYTSDGSGTGAAGDLVYAVNDAGTIKTSVIAAVSNAT